MGTLCHISSLNYGNADKLLAPVEVYAYRAYRCFHENSIQHCENARDIIPANQHAATKSLRNPAWNMIVFVANATKVHISFTVIFHQIASKTFGQGTCLPSISFFFLLKFRGSSNFVANLNIHRFP